MFGTWHPMAPSYLMRLELCLFEYCRERLKRLSKLTAGARQPIYNFDKNLYFGNLLQLLSL